MDWTVQDPRRRDTPGGRPLAKKNLDLDLPTVGSPRRVSVLRYKPYDNDDVPTCLPADLSHLRTFSISPRRF